MKNLKAFNEAIEKQTVAAKHLAQLEFDYRTEEIRIMLNDPMYANAKPAAVGIAYIEEKQAKLRLKIFEAKQELKGANAHLMKAENDYKSERNHMITPLTAVQLKDL